MHEIFAVQQMVRSPTKHEAGEIDQSQLASSVFLSTEQRHIRYHQLRPAQRTQRRLPDQLWASIAWCPYLLSSFSTFGRCGEGSSLLDLVLFNMTPGADTPCPCFMLDDDNEDIVEVISAAAASLTIVPSASDASWGVVGGGEDGHQIPASTSCAPSCIAAREARGGNSVTSALTNAPSLALFSPFAGDFVGGGMRLRGAAVRLEGMDAVAGLSCNG
jgi:hypothetical protein